MIEEDKKYFVKDANGIWKSEDEVIESLRDKLRADPESERVFYGYEQGCLFSWESLENPDTTEIGIESIVEKCAKTIRVSLLTIRKFILDADTVFGDSVDFLVEFKVSGKPVNKEYTFIQGDVKNAASDTREKDLRE